MSKSKSVIWDLDGTLFNSYKVIVSSLKKTLLLYGVKADAETLYRYITSTSVKNYLERLEKTYGFSATEVQKKYDEIENSNVLSVKPVKNSRKTVKRLYNLGVKQYMFTHRGDTANFLLSKYGIEKYFEEILNSKSGFKRKPCPDGINYLIEKHNLIREDVYYIGDRRLDVDSAVNAKVKSILYLRDDKAEKIEYSDFIVDNLIDIVNIMK